MSFTYDGSRQSEYGGVNARLVEMDDPCVGNMGLSMLFLDNVVLKVKAFV